MVFHSSAGNGSGNESSATSDLGSGVRRVSGTTSCVATSTGSLGSSGGSSAAEGRRSCTRVGLSVGKDRVDDALHATRAAVEEGVVPGGGAALLYAAKSLDKLNVADADQRVGIDIVRRALQTPLRQIAENAGEDGAVVAGKLLDRKDSPHGFDAQKGEYVNMIKAGIIDPTKVVRTALQDASSVAGLMITTEAMVAEKPAKKEPAMPGGGDMGGMGGMGGF